jgi:hypothetical protein
VAASFLAFVASASCFSWVSLIANETVRYVIGICMLSVVAHGYVQMLDLGYLTAAAGSMEDLLPKLRIESVDICDVFVKLRPKFGNRSAC